MKNLTFQFWGNHLLSLTVIILLLISASTFGQLSGIKTIPGDYATISAAVTDLNAQGVGIGGVTFNVIAGYTESINAPITITATGTSGNAIVFQKSGVGANPLITRTDAGTLATSTLGGAGDAVIQLNGTDYITFNEIDVAATDQGIEYGYLTHKPSATDGSQFVTITNCVVTLTKGTSAYVAGIYIGNGTVSTSSAVGVVVSAASGMNLNVNITGNTIQNAHAAILLRGATAYPDSVINTSGNTMQNFGGGATATTYGVYVIYVETVTVDNNIINNAGGGGSAHNSTFYCIFFSSGVTGNISASGNTMTITNAGASSNSNYIYSANTGTSEIYNNNTFAQGAASFGTGALYFIYASNGTPNKSISGNSIVGSITKSGGSTYPYYNIGSPSGGTETITNNTFSNINITGGTGTFYGLYSNTAAGHSRVMYGNTLSNINSISTGTHYGIYAIASGNSQVYNNTVNNISAAGTIMGIYAGGTNVLYKNNVYGLTSTAATSIVYGAYSVATDVTWYNNFFSDLNAPNGTNTTASAYGFYITSGTNVNLFYNTVYLDYVSTVASNQSAALYLSSTPTSLDLRNNIFVNNVDVTVGTRAMAIRRNNTTATNLSANTNNNLYYAGIPSAKNVIFYDGTNTDQTLAEYKTRVSPLESASVTEIPPFVNSTVTPYNLHMNTAVATQTESGGIPVAGVTVDYDDDTRNATTPDIGADEFNGIPADLSSPLISYPLIFNQSNTSSISLTANITDASGVASGANLPRMYLKKINDLSYVFDNNPSIAGDNYTFTINYSAIGGVVIGDTIVYYVAAQDVMGNAGTNPAGGSGSNPPGTVPPPTPNFYIITDLPLSGTYTVGLTEFIRVTGRQVYFETKTRTVTRNLNGEGAIVDINDFGDDKNSQGRSPDLTPRYETVTETYKVLMENGKPFDKNFFRENPDGIYPTITAAVEDLNLRGMSGPVVFSLVDTYYPNETYPILFGAVNGASASNTLTIKPAVGIQTEIPGDVAQIDPTLLCWDSDWLIVDGSNTPGGTTKDLKIVGLASGAAIGAVYFYGDASNNLFKNLILESQQTSTGAGTITFGSGPFAMDNNVFQNCSIKNIDTIAAKPQVGIYFFSTNTGVGNQFIDCSIFDWYYYGIRLQGAPSSNLLISGCDIYMRSPGTAAPNAIYISRVDGLIVEKTKIREIMGSSTIRAVYYFGSSTSGDAIFRNNFISLSGSTNLTNNSLYGLDYSAYSANSFEAYHNSIYIGGTDVSGGTTYALRKGAAANTFKAYDNAVYNSRSNLSGTGKHYAVYVSNTTASTFEMDYNDYFVDGTGGVFGYYSGIDVADLATWIATTAKDYNSISENPHYVGNDDLHIQTSYNNLDGKGFYFASVPDDIDGDTRNVTTPDIGADEYIYVPPFVIDPTDVTATAISDKQIDVAFTPNASIDSVVIVFNLTGTFTTPSGPPPSPGDPFAGGTLIYNGTSSPYNHIGLTQLTTYYYKLFSYNGTIYSPGIAVNATTPATPLSVPYSQSFDGPNFPSFWSQSYDNWTVSNTANAGGTPYEMRAIWRSFNGASRLIVGPINTTGFSIVYLKFKHFFDDYGPGITAKIQSSTDAVTWTDEAFTFESGGGNIGPDTVNTIISHNVGTTTYIAWVMDGNHFQYDYWYIDDVSVLEPLANDVGTISIDVASVVNPGNITPQATVKNFGENINTFNVQMIIDGGYSSTKTVTGLAGGATQQVTFDNWDAQPGSFNINVCTLLGSDENTANDCLDKIISVADTSGVWTSGTPIPMTTYLGSGVGVNVETPEALSYVFNIGGNTTSGLMTECYKYNVTTDTWTQIASLPAGRRVHAAANIGNFIYVIGGSNGSAYQSTVYKYDIAGDSWSTVVSLPLAIAWGKAVGYNNHIYFAGGIDASSNYLSTVYVYDVVGNTWSTATSMPGPKFGGAFSITGNKLVYVAGANSLNGISSSVYVGTIDAVDPTLITWTTMASPYPGVNKKLFSEYGGMTSELLANERDNKTYAPEAANYPAGTMFRFDAAPWGTDAIIVANGSPTTDWVPADPNPCYVYKPDTDSWIPQRNVPIPVTGASLGSVNQGNTWTLVVASGWTGGSPLVTNATQIYTFNLGGANTFQLSVDVDNGWNMVSIPGLNTPDQNVNTWWVFRDPLANVFKYGGGYQPITDATPGLGYWMKHAGARTYNTGDEWPAEGISIVPHDPIAGSTGWNLFGGYELSVTATNVTTNPPGLQSGPIYKYSSGYALATTLDPGYGYWIKLTGTGQIIIPETLSKDGTPVEYFPENWGKIILTDATGINYTLYTVKGEVNLDQYELPPAPMAGMFDIRFSSGRIAEDINSSLKTIDMSGVTYPLTVRVEGMDMRLMDETGKTVNVNLKSGEDVVISDATIQKLMVSGEMVPAEYALEQNYPNPFNPSTVIEFSLPENVGNVKLSIYNMLGEKVTELVNSALVAGKYSYQWNAQNVATGMYIYELRTDKFVSVKKMVLIK